ncbi:hypothetical protein [Pleurocapsa sp. PCC 7319]|uniref:hypothetical protein n=1 Tax=Pleurocapsa sp. PCC 7319 TaxID=118161 RepID=UPI000345D549|nr:hypothetical protein [Pleurocapsa sp. PCC 7319]
MMNKIPTAREISRQAIRNSIAVSDWERNWQFSQNLIKKINAHHTLKHPTIKAFSDGEVTFEQMSQFHLEFSYAVVQIFIDAIIQAMSTASQLETRLGLEAKSAARFLLQFNLLEELGFTPGIDTDGSFCGNYRFSHCIQYDETLSQLGVTPTALASYIPTTSSIACRAAFESCYGDHVMMCAILAVGETLFHNLATPWAIGVSKVTDIDITKGFHSIHVEDEIGQSIEDVHSEEGWMLFAQAVTPERYEEIQYKVDIWLTIWSSFLKDAISEHSVSNFALLN